MELSCSVLSRFSIAIPYVDFGRPLSLKSPPQFPCLKFSNKGCNLLVKQARSYVRYDCICQGLSSSHTSEAASLHDEPNQSGEERSDSDGALCSDDSRMVRVCDKLIGVFMVDKPTPTDWRRLLAFSKEWNNLRPHFFARCQDRADDEKDPVMKQNLLRLGRKLREIDEDVQRHNELLQVVKESQSEISEIVSRRRKDFTKEFFEHLYTVAQSYYNNPTEKNALEELGNTCLAAVQEYDAATDSTEALNAAQLKFQDIINSPSLDAACKKIDTLAEKKELDPTLALMITKAWSATKDTNIVKDEAKDMMFHLYKTTVANLQRLVPKEIRIIKYVIRIEDPEEQMCALKDAFTPGEEIEGIHEDTLYTTPEKLHAMVKHVLDAYNLSREGTIMREARDLLNPKIIQKLEELRKVVENNFM